MTYPINDTQSAQTAHVQSERVVKELCKIAPRKCTIDCYQFAHRAENRLIVTDFDIIAIAKDFGPDVTLSRTGQKMAETHDASDLSKLDFEHALNDTETPFVPVPFTRQDWVDIFPCVSTEETRYYLNGVFIDVSDYAENGEIHMVATDGHRLARRTVSASTGFDERKGNVIIPRKLVELLTRPAFKAFTWEWRITDYFIDIRDAKNGVRFVSKLIEATYPDYKRVIPEPSIFKARFTGNSKRVLESLKPFIKYAGKRECALKIDPNGDISAQYGDYAPMTGRLPIVINGDMGAPIGVNIKYLADMLKSFGDSDFTWYVDAYSPNRFEGKNGFTGVIIPMRV